MRRVDGNDAEIRTRGTVLVELICRCRRKNMSPTRLVGPETCCYVSRSRTRYGSWSSKWDYGRFCLAEFSPLTCCPCLAFEDDERRSLCEALLEFTEIDIILEDAVCFCGDGTDHETIVASFEDLHEQARCGINIQRDDMGNITPGCLRLLWRFLVFRGRTGGARVDLRMCEDNTPGNLIYTLSASILGRNP